MGYARASLLGKAEGSGDGTGRGRHDRRLLWVDLFDFDETELRQAAALFSLTRESVSSLLQKERWPRLDQYVSTAATRN
jgi:hypothetical protein